MELALLDAVLSIRARHGRPDTGLRRQVALWRGHRSDSADDLRILATSDVGKIVTNRQKLSGGLRKPEAVQRAAAALAAANLVRRV